MRRCAQRLVDADFGSAIVEQPANRAGLVVVGVSATRSPPRRNARSLLPEGSDVERGAAGRADFDHTSVTISMAATSRQPIVVFQQSVGEGVVLWLRSAPCGTSIVMTSGGAIWIAVVMNLVDAAGLAGKACASWMMLGMMVSIQWIVSTPT